MSLSVSSKRESIYANEIVLTSITGTNVDISCSTGNVLINGSSPSGGGASLPIIGTGNIEVQGNIKAQGNGSTTGLLEGQNIKSQGNLIVEGSLSLAGALSGINIAGNGALTMNTGNISQSGGSFSQTGAGSLTVGTGGLSSNGEIQTLGSNDIVSGKDIYFDGTDIFKREVSGNPPVVSNTSYKDYKKLAGKDDNNIFTGANQFNSNTTEFAAKVSVGTRDVVSQLFTQNLALNTSGNIESKTINNNTTIQCGNINCGNAALNEVRARVFNTRTNEHNQPDGWLIEQGLPNVPADPVDKILQIRAQEAGAVVSITPSDFIGTNPAIILDPNDTANGGKIFAANFTLGTTVDRYRLTQDLTGGLSDTLQISAPTASSKVEFRDNSNNVILDVNKTNVALGSTIPINFGAYSWRPIQYYKDINGFSFNSSAIGPTNLIFTTQDTDWTNANTGASNQNLNLDVFANRGAFKLTFRQTNAGTLGQINDMRIMSDIVLTRPNDGDPNSTLPSPSAFAFEAYDGTSTPIITTTPGSFVMNVYAQFPGVSGNETANVRITLTKMDYFA